MDISALRPERQIPYNYSRVPPIDIEVVVWGGTVNEHQHNEIEIQRSECQPKEVSMGGVGDKRFNINYRPIPIHKDTRHRDQQFIIKIKSNQECR